MSSIAARFHALNMELYRPTLNNYRKTAIERFWPGKSEQIKHLESRYGKYLFLPLDLPQPTPKPGFIDWWEENSKPITMLKTDITERSRVSGNDRVYGGEGIFNSINSPTSVNDFFESNVRDDTSNYVNNLEEFVSSLKTTRKSYNLWSSNRPISYHRDTGPWLDLPCMFRAMVYDTNPQPTFSIVESPTDTPYNSTALAATALAVPRVDGCITFGLNNVRTEHGSLHHDGFKKCIMICNASPFDLDAYEDLIERSIKKYGDYAIISSLPSHRFYD